jgi:hypothetical protein
MFCFSIFISRRPCSRLDGHSCVHLISSASSAAKVLDFDSHPISSASFAVKGVAFQFSILAISAILAILGLRPLRLKGFAFQFSFLVDHARV